MIKTLVLALSILTIVGIAFVSADNEKVKITKDAITGKIVSIEADKNTIIVRDAKSNKDVTYMFNETTTFYRDGSVVEVKTLVPDEEVTLSLSPDDKTLIVRLDTPIVVVKEE